MMPVPGYLNSVSVLHVYIIQDVFFMMLYKLAHALLLYWTSCKKWIVLAVTVWEYFNYIISCAAANIYYNFRIIYHQVPVVKFWCFKKSIIIICHDSKWFFFFKYAVSF